MSEDDSTADTSRGWRLINTKDFGLLWWGQTTSQIGEELNKVALLWFVYDRVGYEDDHGRSGPSCRCCCRRSDLDRMVSVYAAPY